MSGPEPLTSEPLTSGPLTSEPSTSRAPRSRALRRAALLPASVAAAVLLAGCTSGSAVASKSAPAVPGASAGAGTKTAAGQGLSTDSSLSIDPSVSTDKDTSADQAYPALLPAQAQRVTAAVGAALGAAVEGKAVARAGNRVVGPAQQVLGAALKVAAGRGQAPQVPSTIGASRLVLPPVGPWPRWFLAAGTVAGRPTPAVEIFVSASARTPYGLWGQLFLLPGATFPEAAASAAGAQTLSPGATDLLMSPAEVAVRYADLLNRGQKSASLALFTPDAFRAQLDQRLAKDRASIVSSGLATLTDTHAPRKDALYAVRTVDGGALVVLAIDQAYVVDVAAGAGAVTADADLAALAGRTQFTSSLNRRAVELLAFHVPARGARSTVTLVAASKADVSATGS